MRIENIDWNHRLTFNTEETVNPVTAGSLHAYWGLLAAPQGFEPRYADPELLDGRVKIPRLALTNQQLTLNSSEPSGSWAKLRMPFPCVSIDRVAQLGFLVFNRTGPSACKDDIMANGALRLHDSPVDHQGDNGFQFGHSAMFHPRLHDWATTRL